MTEVIEQADRVIRGMAYPKTLGPDSGSEPGEYIVVRNMQIVATFSECCISCAEKTRRVIYPDSDCLGVLIPPEDAEGECIEEALRRLGE